MPEYISKESVLLKCADIWDNADETTQTGVDTINTIDKITDFIESLPAADVQPVKRGRWEQIGEQSAKCTVCGGVLKSNGIDKTGKALIFNAVYHYCSYCGARMDGET